MTLDTRYSNMQQNDIYALVQTALRLAQSVSSEYSSYQLTAQQRCSKTRPYPVVKGVRVLCTFESAECSRTQWGESFQLPVNVTRWHMPASATGWNIERIRSAGIVFSCASSQATRSELVNNVGDSSEAVYYRYATWMRRDNDLFAILSLSLLFSLLVCHVVCAFLQYFNRTMNTSEAV